MQHCYTPANPYQSRETSFFLVLSRKGVLHVPPHVATAEKIQPQILSNTPISKTECRRCDRDSNPHPTKRPRERLNAGRIATLPGRGGPNADAPLLRCGTPFPQVYCRIPSGFPLLSSYATGLVLSHSIGSDIAFHGACQLCYRIPSWRAPRSKRCL